MSVNQGAVGMIVDKAAGFEMLRIFKLHVEEREGDELEGLRLPDDPGRG